MTWTSVRKEIFTFSRIYVEEKSSIIDVIIRTVKTVSYRHAAETPITNMTIVGVRKFT